MFVPSRRFSRLTYDDTTNKFVITDQNDETTMLPATQKVLDDFHIQLNISKFKEGVIKKPIAIPGTYTQIEQHPQGSIDVIKSPILGVMDSVDIMIFVLILGGIIGLVNKVGAFDARIKALSKRTKDNCLDFMELTDSGLWAFFIIQTFLKFLQVD